MSKETKPKRYKVTVLVDEETWVRLWNYIATKYISPWRRMSEILREAIVDYLDKHEKELKKRRRVKRAKSKPRH